MFDLKTVYDMLKSLRYNVNPSLSILIIFLKTVESDKEEPRQRGSVTGRKSKT